jgi:hypothetical protein
MPCARTRAHIPIHICMLNITVNEQHAIGLSAGTIGIIEDIYVGK